MVYNVALVGASNLVHFKRQCWQRYTCLNICQVLEHASTFPKDIHYKIFARGSAKLGHPKPEKKWATLIKEAVEWGPNVIVNYHDIISNSLTLPPFLKETSKNTPLKAEVFNNFNSLQREFKQNFVFVLTRRRTEDNFKLAANTSRPKEDQPLEFQSNLDIRMNKISQRKSPIL